MSGEPEEVVPPAVGQFTILDLERRSCRWPSGSAPPYLYCGALTIDEARPYCARHERVAYAQRRR